MLERHALGLTQELHQRAGGNERCAHRVEELGRRSQLHIALVHCEEAFALDVGDEGVLGIITARRADQRIAVDVAEVPDEYLVGLHLLPGRRTFGDGIAHFGQSVRRRRPHATAEKHLAQR
jgi:hypothetical protein